MTVHRSPIAVLFASLLAFTPAQSDTVPFRLVFNDNFENLEAFDREASDVCGLRLSVFDAVSKRMYGISIAGGFDGRASAGHFVWDDEWAGLKIGCMGSLSCGSGYGLQFSFIGSSTDGRMTGLQIGGLLAECGILNGIQVAGGSRVEMGMVGIQIGVLSAVIGEEDREGAGDDASGIQIAALRSRFWHGTFTGLQVGATTFADELSGVQIGALNITESLHGLQIGIANRARDLHGVQIGIVNISGDTNGGNFRVLPLLNARF